MQKKISFLLFLLFSFAFICSCEDDDSLQEIVPADLNNGKVSVEFINNSPYAVNVFQSAHRNLGGEVLVTVPPSDESELLKPENGKRSSRTVSLLPSVEKTGDVFYFEYILPIGNLDFPYFSYDNSQIYVISNGKTNEINIGNLEYCKDKKTFLVVENNSDYSIYLLNGGDILTPQDSETHLINDSGVAVFLIGQTDLDVYNKNSSQFTISNGTDYKSLPKFDFSAGYTYTITVTSFGISLKSISPFNVDTQKQIWSSQFKQSFLKKYTVDCARSLYDLKDGSFFCGSKKLTNTFYIQEFDVYGAEKRAAEFMLLDEDVVDVSVIDALQCSDKEYLVLLRGYCDTNDDDYYSLASYFYLGKFNIETYEKKLINLTYFVQNELDFENLYFYGNLIKGAVCELSASEFSVCGSVFDSVGKMHYFSAITDFSSSTPAVSSYWVSEDSTKYHVLRTLASSYFDGSDLYVCGFDNFNEKYGVDSDAIHKGVIFKFDSDLSSAEEIYSNEKSLFFGITGKDGSFYVCGETMGAAGDNDLYGCFLNSDMVSENSSPLKYFSTKKNTWFTQINFTNYGLTVCGVNSEDTEGKITGDVDGILTCVSPSGEKLWENEYASYYKVISMAENNIGTQILHLKTKDGASKIISTDLLGKEI